MDDVFSSHPPGTGQASDTLEHAPAHPTGGENGKVMDGVSPEIYLSLPSDRHRHESSSSMVSNGGYVSAQGTPQSGRCTPAAQAGAQIEEVCKQIGEELLQIRLYIQDMAAAAMK
jgi:hypothetical protein